MHRRRRWLWALLGVPLLVFALTVLGLFVLPWIFPPEAVAEALERRLSAALTAEVAVERVEPDVFSGFRVSGLRIGPPPGYRFDVLRVRSLELRYDALALMTGRIRVTDVIADTPMVTVEFVGETSNLEALLPSESEAVVPTTPPPADAGVVDHRAVIESLEVLGLGVRFVKGAWDGRVDGLGLKLGAELDGDALEVGLAFSFEGSGHAQVDDRAYSFRSASRVLLDGEAAIGAPTVIRRAALSSQVGIFELRGFSDAIADTSVHLTLDATAGAGRVALRRLFVRVDDAPVLDVSGIAENLSRVGELIDLGGAGTPRFRGQLAASRIDLARFQPILADLVPDLTVGGVVGLGPGAVDFGMEGLGSGVSAEVELALDAVALAMPSKRLDPTTGRLALSLMPGGKVSVGGEVRASGARIAGLRVGPCTLGLTATASGAPEAAFQCAHVSGPDWAVAGLSGTLQFDRAELLRTVLDDPLRFRLGAAAKSLSGVLDVRELRLVADGSVDALLAPEAIQTAVNLHARELRWDTLGLESVALRLDLSSEAILAQDRPVEARLGLRISRGELLIPPEAIEFENLVLGIDAPKLRLGPALEYDAGVRLRIPRLVYGSEAMGRLSSPVDFSGAVRGGPETVSFDKLRLRLRHHLNFGANGRVRWPWLRLDVTVDDADIASTMAALPGPLRAAIEPLRLGGKLAGRGRFEGVVPEGAPKLARLPFDAELELSLREFAYAESDFSVDGGVLDVMAALGPGTARIDVAAQASAIRALDVTLKELRLRSQVDDTGGTLTSSIVLDGSIVREGRAGALGFKSRLRYARGGDIEIQQFDVTLPGLVSTASGCLLRLDEGWLSPQVSWGVSADPEFSLWPIDLTGRATLQAELTGDADRSTLKGALGFERLSGRGGMLTALDGHLPFEQTIRMGALAEGPSRPDVFAEFFEDDAVARVGETVARFASSRLLVEDRDILSVQSEGAEYDVMRSFYHRAPRLRLNRFVHGDVVVDGVNLDLRYRNGVVDILGAGGRLWEGDLLVSGAAQISPEGAPRARLRATMTGINVDAPTARLLDIEAAGPDEAGRYVVGGVLDLRADLAQRRLAAEVDVRLGPETVVRLIDAIDPEGRDDELQAMRDQLSQILEGVLPWFFGERLAGIQVSVRQNLLNQRFVWERELNWNPIVLVFRGLQIVSGFLSEWIAGQRWEPTLVNLVPEVRRRNLAELWGLAVFDALDSQMVDIRRVVAPLRPSPLTGDGTLIEAARR